MKDLLWKIWHALTLPFRILWVLIQILLTISDEDFMEPSP